MGERKALGGSFLQQGSADFHVFEADGSDVKTVVEVLHVSVDVKVGDVLLGRSRKLLMSLIKGEPD